MLTKDHKLKAIIRLQFLMVMACIVTGWLAGVAIEKYLVRVPAWKKVDILLWAEYSRHAFFGSGFIIHQIEAGCSFILLLVSSIIVIRNRLNFVAWQIYVATLLTISGIVFTFVTAPIMFSLPELGNDPVLLQNAFNKVYYWGSYRAVAQILSFCTCAWAMGRCFVIRYVRVS